jgi:hypothetical protein
LQFTSYFRYVLPYFVKYIYIYKTFIIIIIIE